MTVVLFKMDPQTACQEMSVISFYSHKFGFNKWFEDVFTFVFLVKNMKE